MGIGPTYVEVPLLTQDQEGLPFGEDASGPPPLRARKMLAGLRRAGQQIAGSVAVILAVVTITFLVTRVFAPDPTSLFLPPTGNGYVNSAAAAVERARVRASLGLGKPISVQYWHFLVNLIHGNLGISFETGRPVTTDLLARLPATAELAIYSLIIGVTLGIIAGVVSAVRRDGMVDHVVRFFNVAGLSLPQFWVGLMLLWVFFEVLHIAPGPVGRLPIGVSPPHRITGFYVVDGLLEGNWTIALDAAKQLILPVITLAIGLGTPICKIVRTSMVEALTSDYVRTATAMGFGRRRIWMIYALKNGLLPVVTVLAGIIAFTFCGTILIEGIFGWPGIGNYALQSIQASDFPAIQGFVLYAACLYVLLYELLNYVYSLIDPRIRS